MVIRVSKFPCLLSSKTHGRIKLGRRGYGVRGSIKFIKEILRTVLAGYIFLWQWKFQKMNTMLIFLSLDSI